MIFGSPSRRDAGEASPPVTMSAQSPKSYILSGLVHAFVVAALMVAAWVMQNPQREPTKVLDLVAGDGDNWSATEAPALGSPGGSEAIKVPNIPMPMPKIEEPTPEPPAVQSEPPIESAPVTPAPEVKPAPRKTPAKAAVVKDPLDRKNFVKDIKRLSTKRERRILEKYHREQAAEAKRISEAEFRKLHEARATAANGRFSKIDAKGIARGVVGGSTANKIGGAGGKALSVAEQRLMDQYFAFLKQKLRHAHVPPPGVSDQLTATVEFFLAADGSISNVRVVNSSGNAEFDQSVVEAFKSVHSIGPRPDGQSDTLELDFNTKEE